MTPWKYWLIGAAIGLAIGVASMGVGIAATVVMLHLLTGN
jgi:hypothetical protein